MALREQKIPESPRLKSRRSLAHISTLRSTDLTHLTTDVGPIVNEKRSAASQRNAKKIRSLSIGPGGIASLEEISGNNYKIPSVAKVLNPPPKPILKITMPLSPEIPAHSSTRRESPTKVRKSSEELARGQVGSAFRKNVKSYENDRFEDSLHLGNRAVDNETRVNLKTEEEQHAAMRKREDKEKQELEKEIMSRQDARRKSLANRRVSFAPEATLHTWDIVVEYQDSTTSTNSTRGAPLLSNRSPGSPHQKLDAPGDFDPYKHATPSIHVEDDTESRGHSHHHHAHQKKHHRGSSVIPIDSHKPDDEKFSSSPLSNNSIDDDNDDNVHDDILDEDISVSNSDLDDDGTLMTLDDRETTNISISSAKSSVSSGSSIDLKEALVKAAHHAGTNKTKLDHNKNLDGDQEMGSFLFKPWPKKNSDDNVTLGNEKDGVKEPTHSGNRRWASEFNLQIQPNKAKLIPLTQELNEKARESFQFKGEEATDMTISTSRITSPSEPNSDNKMEIATALGGILQHTQKANQVRPQMNNLAEQDDTTDMEITSAIGGILQPVQPTKNTRSQSVDFSEQNMTTEMEITSALGGILQPAQQAVQVRPQMNNLAEQDDTTDMEITSAIGGILQPVQPTKNARSQSVDFSEQNMTTEMEITSALGGIIQHTQKANQVRPQMINLAEQDDTTDMEITSAIGGILQSVQPTKNTRSQSVDFSEQNMTTEMEITSALGGILQPAQQAVQVRPQMNNLAEQDDITEMEITSAIGGISNSTPKIDAARSRAKKVMEMETNIGAPPFDGIKLLGSFSKSLYSNCSDKFYTGTPVMTGLGEKASQRSSLKEKLSILDSEFHVHGIAENLEPSSKHPSTPSKSERDTMSRKNPSNSLFKNTLNVAKTPSSATGKILATPSSLYFKDEQNGIQTPCFIPNAQARQISGIGLDKIGLGSPRVAALLDRRGSISDEACSFSPCRLSEISLGARLVDPRSLETEINKDLKEDNEDFHANFRKVSIQSIEEKDITLNLKEKIQSLTPRKKPTRIRKSLHLGTAKGLLGKRPIELDEDDEDSGGIKRLNLHVSPVKNVKLHAPPSKTETTSGRMTRAARRSPEQSIIPSADSVSPKINELMASKIQNTNNYRPQICNKAGIHPPVYLEPIDKIKVREGSHEEHRIHLQDFLDITGIRFMELNTSKRRRTTLIKSTVRDRVEKRATLEDCVAAGAATIPMLELFQHACHELKRYISEGRKTIREIESETWEENPPFFQEYISATSDIKIIMNNQLKNVKTHARLLSKGLWYDWRITLLSTLKEGLIKSAEGMSNDEKVIDHQISLLNPTLPDMIEMKKRLEHEEIDLKTSAEEIAICDQEELSKARQILIAANREIEAKKLAISNLRRQLHEKGQVIKANLDRKQLCQEEIDECEKIRVECRGWTPKEINETKNRVVALEIEYGWTIIAVSHTIITMTYQREIELSFDVNILLLPTSTPIEKLPSSLPVHLSLIGLDQSFNYLSRATENEFFSMCMLDYLRGIKYGEKTAKSLLDSVSTSWNKVKKVLNEIDLLSLNYQTETSIESVSSMKIKSTLLLVPLATKILISFLLGIKSGDNGINIEITPKICVIYGERFNEPKMEEFIRSRCGDVVAGIGRATTPSWKDTVDELSKKLFARGKK